MEITREVRLDAPAEEVWESLAEASWLGGDAAIDPRPSGEVRSGERSGFVEQAAAPHRLVFWWSAPNEETSRVELDLEEAEDGTTLVRVVESRPLAVLDVRGVDAIVGAGGPPMPEMSAVSMAAL